MGIEPPLDASDPQIIETERKLLLVGFATFVKPGSIMQLIAGLSLSIIAFALQLQAQPYKDRFDDMAASGMLLCTVSMFICCVLLKVRLA